MVIVKVHGVFPSSCKKLASSRVLQFHWDHTGDSGKVVTPFMQVGTYPTRNFATFGPSELRPPFTGTYVRCQNISLSFSSTGQVSIPIRLLTNQQRPVFLLNSRYPQFCASSSLQNLIYISHLLFRSYEVILPSSFSMVRPSTLVYSTCSPVSVQSTVIFNC